MSLDIDYALTTTLSSSGNSMLNPRMAKDSGAHRNIAVRHFSARVSINKGKAGRHTISRVYQRVFRMSIQVSYTVPTSSFVVIADQQVLSQLVDFKEP